MDSLWIMYLGAAAGSIGAVSGIIGVIISIISFRRISSIKALDLRMEAARTRDETSILLERVTELRRNAIKSRTNYASATGMTNSGAMVKWQKKWSDDERKVNQLELELPKTNSDFDNISPQKMAKIIVDIHCINKSLAEISNQYKDDLKSDEKNVRLTRKNRGAYRSR